MTHDEALVMTTAPSDRQVKETIWREIKTIHHNNKSLVVGKITATRLEPNNKRVASRATILENLRQLNTEFGISIIYITHNLTTAYEINEKIVVLYRGVVGEQGDADRILEARESRAYQPLLAHRPVVMAGGIEMMRLGSNHSEMEFIAASEWSVEEVSRAFGAPKVFLSEYDDATLSNISVMEQFLWRNTVIPELRMLEDGLNRGLVPGYETGGERLEIRFDLTAIEAVQESQSEKAERVVNLVQGGIMTVEEARAEIGL